jgi:PAS domain S-box-containing protein
MTREAALRQRNAELAEIAASFRAFFDHAEDSLCDVEVTPDGRFLCRNFNPHAEAVMGISAAAVRGKSPEQILGPEAGGRIAAALARCVERGGLRYEETWDTVRGSRITDTIMVPLREGGATTGPVTRILCSMRDITDRRALQSQLAQAQRLQALGQLAGGIAHDFNNVLQAIVGNVALIELRPEDRESVLHRARMVREATTRASSITRRLLAFARRDELRSEAVDTAGMLVDLRDVVAATLGPSIEVRIETAAALPNVLADRGQLETVLINLATNARDAMPQGGRLVFTARAETTAEDPSHPAGLRAGAYVRIDAIDSGTGMDAATLARAAEPFFTTKPRGQGTGLGLAMARGFAEQSGGALGIASVLGGGATVSLWLPQAPAALRTEPPEPVPVQRATAATPDILVVDDDELVRETLSSHLQEIGYTVHGAESGAAALAWLERGAALDLLLTDFSMPGMDGLTLIGEARRRRPGLEAILLTGYAGDLATPPQSPSPGGDFRLLRKPITAARLSDEVAAVLARSPRRAGRVVSLVTSA